MSSLATEDVPSEESQLSFALVGSSGFAARMVAPALARSDAGFAGVLGSTPQRGAGLADRLGVGGYDSLDELLADPTVDAVWVATKDVLHEPIGVACMEAGKHVLMEKPMATNTAGARALIAASQRSRLAVAGRDATSASARCTATCANLIAAGSLGTIGFVRLQFLWEFRGGSRAGQLARDARRQRRLVGDKEFGAHLLDLLLWWTGPVRPGRRDVCTRRFAVETEDCAAMLLELASGAIGIVEVSAAMRGRTNASRSRAARLGARTRRVARERLGGKRHGRGASVSQRRRVGALSGATKDFTAAVAGRPSTGADGPDGLAVLELIDRAIAAGRG